MERGRDETRGKESMMKREGEIRASSTNMIEQLGSSGCLPEYQGSRHERSILPTQLLVYPPEKLNQYSHLAPQEHSEDLSIHCESQKLQTRPDDAELDEETRGSLPTRAIERGGDAREDSAISLMSVNVFPDDVVSVIGQIPFWKARSTIVNQQRLFAAQLFELHRLIKVQKLMAESPDMLFEEGAFLGNPLKASAQKKVRLYNDVEPISSIDKHEVVHEKTQKRIQSLETAVKKTTTSSSQTDNKKSHYKEPRSGQIGLLLSPRPSNYLAHKLLRAHYPAFSPAISIPPSLIPSMPPSSFCLYKMEAVHKCYQNICNMQNQNWEVATEVFKLGPSNNVVHVSMANTSNHMTQTTSSTPSASFPAPGWPLTPLMPPSSKSMYKVDYYHKCYQTLCNLLNQNNEFAKELMKFNPFRNEVRTASTCSLIHSGIKQHVLSVSPTSPSITISTSNQPIQHFKILPHNARSATQQDELGTDFNSSDDDFDSEDLSISTDKIPSSPDNDEACDKETRITVPLISPALDSKNKMDDLCNHQSTCNILNQNSGLAAEVIKFTQSKDIVVQASMTITGIQAAQISSFTPNQREVEQPVVSIFRASPANNLGTPKQPSPDFKLVPYNARSATQSSPQTFHPSQNTLKENQDQHD